MRRVVSILGWLAGVQVAALAAGCGDDEELVMELDGGGPGALLDAGARDARFPLPDGACEPVEERVTLMSPFVHLAGDIVYPDPPPAGGNHNACWAVWGVHQQEVPDERWVHNLEHGGVVFLYRCPEGCPRAVELLSEFVSGRDQALLTPYSELPTRFGVVAWGFRVLTDCFDQASFQAFYADHVNNGPEKIAKNPPADCF